MSSHFLLLSGTEGSRKAVGTAFETPVLGSCWQGRRLQNAPSRDFAISNSQVEARKAIRRAGSFDDLLRSHTRRWEHLWSISGMKQGDTRTFEIESP